MKEKAVEPATYSLELVWGSLRAFLIGGDPKPGPRTKVRLALTVLSWLVAIGTALWVLANLDESSPLPTVVIPIVSVAVVAPFVLMLKRPLLAWRIAWVTAVFAGIVLEQGPTSPWPWPPVELAVLMVSVFAVALRHPRGVAVWTWLSALVLVFLFVDFNAIPGVVIGLTVLMVIGDQIRRRREVQSRLVAEKERSELETARRTVLEERTRIARELHDVVAHHMSLIAVRAESAPFRLEGMPEPVAEEFGAIANASREALTEMRRLLGVLRSETPPPVQPQPGVEDLTELVEAARGAGVDVRLDLPAGLRVPPSVGLTAYRIVQEALSNARRHASGAAVTITLVEHGPDLDLTVVNGPGPSSQERGQAMPPQAPASRPPSSQERGQAMPPQAPASRPPSRQERGQAMPPQAPASRPPSSQERGQAMPPQAPASRPPSSTSPTGGSQGLIGMYERATMLGGSLTTGATEDGGFRVHGTIPLGGAQ